MSVVRRRAILIEVVFASSNSNKFDEAKEILEPMGVSVRFRSCRLVEQQTTDVASLIKQKCLDAYASVGRPLFVEHTTLHSVDYGGFPAGLTSVFLETVGLNGASELLGKPGKNKAYGKTTIAYTDGFSIKFFDGHLNGEILEVPALADTEWKKFGWNPIFMPDGYDCSLAEMGMELKNSISMRRKALEKFVGDLTA